MMIIEMKTATITDKGQISIPRQIREIEGFNVGDKVAVIAFKDRVELRPLDKIYPALMSEKSLSEWNSKEEDKAWKDL
ncbi:AbrB/MazE/SpoVT family DNA-binding domain-containing protein [Candidatus Woesearchaeota archaeon]|nr:AbrB/MazE/SpoVT family DNA-binding domain-containing protein [Candidatus Woesearchaeota archaeon]